MHRRGFILLLCLGILSMLGALILAYGVWSSSELRRNDREAAQAQLRELILAGLQSAPSLLETNLTQQSIDLPAALSPAHLTIHAINRSDTQATIELQAQFANQTLTQTASFTQAGNHWTLTSLN